jgi:hypothetical protein
VTSIWTIEQQYEERSDDTNNIHEQSECYVCKQYECNEYVRSALARSKVTIEERSDDIIKDKSRQKTKAKANLFKEPQFPRTAKRPSKKYPAVADIYC